MMRRYRKGQTFRPPTAAESAAHADAVEAFRCRPAEPQDLAPCGQIHEGKLDADLAYNDTTGVTVTIWKGNPQVAMQDKIIALPPIVMTSGTLTSGDPVIIQLIDGHWRVTHAEC